MQKCLGCYQLISKKDSEKSSDKGYHEKCSKLLFGISKPPTIDFGIHELEKRAEKSLLNKLGITGVQPKLSLHLRKQGKQRLMIVDLWGDYILKPPNQNYPEIAELEDLTMHMASAAQIDTAKHGLIPLASGELAYITQRFDRDPSGKKFAMEDFCQLSELLTEFKYNSSSERAGKIILKHSSFPGLDVVRFFDIILFCFLTGNSDMHLKNYSLIVSTNNEYTLSPAYDLLPTQLLIPADKEEVALTINGKKSKLKRKDFIELGKTLEIPEKAINNSFRRIQISIPKMKQLLRSSLLTPLTKRNYASLIDDRAKRLFSNY